MADVKKADLAALHQMIDSMAVAIAPIVAGYEKSEEAHAEKLKAQIALIDAILALAAPTVRAIGTRPKIWEASGSDDSYPNQRASWRGLALTCPIKEISVSNSEPEPPHITGEPDAAGYSRGTIAGSHVFLTEHGDLVKLSYTGVYHVVRGGYNEWRATEQRVSVEEFCRDNTSAANPKALATLLLKFIEKAGDRSKGIAKATELTTKYRAIVTLL